MLGSISDISSTAPNAGSNTGKTLGRNDFLKIFLAQLKYQDPLNPMEGTEFTAQLAQFSSLEQLFNVNEHLESLNSAETESKKFQALSLIGKEVFASGSTLSLEQLGEATGAFRIGEEAHCVVQIIDSNGIEIRRLDLGVLEPGEHQFGWDGLDQNGNRMPSGPYDFKVLAVDAVGGVVNVDTMIIGLVDKVSVEGETPVLYLGEVAVGLNQVLDIRRPSTELTEDQGDIEQEEL